MLASFWASLKRPHQQASDAPALPEKPDRAADASDADARIKGEDFGAGVVRKLFGHNGDDPPEETRSASDDANHLSEETNGTDKCSDSPSTSSSGALLPADNPTENAEQWGGAGVQYDDMPQYDDAPMPPRHAASGAASAPATVFSIRYGGVEMIAPRSLGLTVDDERISYLGAAWPSSPSSVQGGAQLNLRRSVSCEDQRARRKKKLPLGLPPSCPDANSRQCQSWCSVPICSPLLDGRGGASPDSHALDVERRAEWVQDSACRV